MKLFNWCLITILFWTVISGCDEKRTPFIPETIPDTERVIACVMSGEHELFLLDIINYTSISILNRYQFQHKTVSMTVWENMVYAVTQDSGVQLIDITYPTEPVTMGKIFQYGILYFINSSIWADGEHLIFGDYMGRFWTVDISNPATPVRLSSSEFGGSQLGIRVYKNLCFVIIGVFDKMGIRILNIEEMDNPVLISESILDAQPIDIAFGNNDYAYVPTLATDLYAINFSNPENPEVTNSMNGYNTIRGIVAEGGYLFCANIGFGLLVYDLDDPANPTELFFAEDNLQVIDIAINGAIAYLIDYTKGVVMYNISDPKNPRLIGIHSLPSTNLGKIYLTFPPQ